jgi:hypothetical protein
MGESLSVERVELFCPSFYDTRKIIPSFEVFQLLPDFTSYKIDFNTKMRLKHTLK